MNSGIYALYWWEQDLVYVGLSQNLSNRKKEHFTLLKNNKHTNYKVQNAYNNFGIPDFIILEYVEDILKLPELEVYWCNELNALGKNGLCLVEPGVVGFGTNSNASKYSKIQILRCFSLLSSNKLYTTSEILYRLSFCNKSLLYEITSGTTHLWLREAYPTRYTKMLSNIKPREVIARGIYNKCNAIQKLVSPDGCIHEVSSITKFVGDYFKHKDPSIVRGLARVIDGTRKQYKGWKIAV